MICAVCGKQNDTKANRLPRAWKRRQGEVYCAKCWGERFVLRAVTIPIVGPVGEQWSKLREALGAAWSQTTELSNWLLTESYANDVRRDSKMSKLPPMPATYLYPQARRRFPNLPSYTVAAIEHAVRGKYRTSRYDIIWTCSKSLANYRYPVPFPIRSDGWKPRFDSEGTPLVDVRIGGQRWTLRLRSGSQFARQLTAFRSMVAGEAETSEMALYRQKANKGDHRSGIESRTAGGGQRAHYRVMCKMVAWIPRQQCKQKGAGSITLHTSLDSFWCAEVEGSQAGWVLHADHVRRLQHAHQRNRKRLMTDLKDGKRHSARSRRGLSERLANCSEKYGRRIQSFCHEATAHFAKFAERQKVARVLYDDSERGFVSEFPWYRLRKLLAEKLDERGIEFVGLDVDDQAT